MLRELAGITNDSDLSQKNQIPSRIVLFSIHQPTSDIFHLFTNIVLMNAGRIIFQGSVQEAQTLFNNMGLICPSLYNPAEFYVNKISDADIAREIVKSIGEGKVIDALEFSEETETHPETNGAKVSWLRQVALLSHRGALNFIHNPRDYLIEVLILCVSFDCDEPSGTETFSFLLRSTQFSLLRFIPEFHWIPTRLCKTSMAL